jgi:branched-chain amino acid aminotransferase
VIRHCILDYRIRRQDEVSVSALSPALLYGDSLFETLPVVETVPVFLDAHLERLNHSAAVLGYRSRLKGERLRAAIENLLTGNRLESGRLRITLFRGSPPQAVSETGGDGTAREHLLIQLDALEDRAPCAAGLARVNNRDLDPLARHKTGNRLFYRLFRHWEDPLPLPGGSTFWLHPRDADEREVLVVDERDRLLEGTVSNLFLVVDGVPLTPPRELGVLPGIVRGRLLEDERLGARAAELSLRDLAVAEEAFLSNSVTGVRPLLRVGPHGFPQAPGPVTRRAQAALEHRVLQELDAQLG